MEDTITADALKKITTDALDKLATLLDEGRSDQLTALLAPQSRPVSLSTAHELLTVADCL